MIREAIYLGRSNTIDWQLQVEQVAVDLLSVTRMVVTIDGVALDSDNLGGNALGNAFYWTGNIPAEGVANLFLKLGPAALAGGITAGRKSMRLTVYDPDNPTGLVWIGNEEVLIS